MKTIVFASIFLISFFFCINYAKSMDQNGCSDPSCIDDAAITNALERLQLNDLEGAIAELHYAIDARKNTINPFDPMVLEALQMQEFQSQMAARR